MLGKFGGLAEPSVKKMNGLVFATNFQLLVSRELRGRHVVMVGIPVHLMMHALMLSFQMSRTTTVEQFNLGDT